MRPAEAAPIEAPARDGVSALACAVLRAALDDWRRLDYPLAGPLAVFLLARAMPLRALWCAAAGVEEAAFVAACWRLASSRSSSSSGAGRMRTERRGPGCTTRSSPASIRL